MLELLTAFPVCFDHECHVRRKKKSACRNAVCNERHSRHARSHFFRVSSGFARCEVTLKRSVGLSCHGTWRARVSLTQLWCIRANTKVSIWSYTWERIFITFRLKLRRVSVGLPCENVRTIKGWRRNIRIS